MSNRRVIRCLQHRQLSRKTARTASTSTAGSALRTFELDEKDIDPDDEDPFEEHLSMAACAIRSSFHATHGHSPAELVFGRNMFLPVNKPVDWEKIRERKQRAIAKSNLRENAKRTDHTYQKGDWITVKLLK